METTTYTDKWYKITVWYCDNSYYTEDFFGEWMEFRYSNRDMKGAITNKVKDIPEEVFEIIFWIYDFDREYDGDGQQAYYKHLAEELQEKYYIYPINVYEHSNFAFRLWTIDKKYWIDGVLLLEKSMFSEEYAKDEKKIDEFLHNDYTDYFNWRIYKIDIFKPHKWTDQEWNEMETYDYIDGMWGFFRDNLDSEYADYFEDTYWKSEQSLQTF
jgi:hypothetical protein